MHLQLAAKFAGMYLGWCSCMLQTPGACRLLLAAVSTQETATQSTVIQHLPWEGLMAGWQAAPSAASVHTHVWCLQAEAADIACEEVVGEPDVLQAAGRHAWVRPLCRRCQSTAAQCRYSNLHSCMQLQCTSCPVQRLASCNGCRAHADSGRLPAGMEPVRLQKSHQKVVRLGRKDQSAGIAAGVAAL